MTEPIEHVWMKTSNFIYCVNCMVVKGSDPDKNSKCPGHPPTEEPKP